MSVALCFIRVIYYISIVAEHLFSLRFTFYVW